MKSLSIMLGVLAMALTPPAEAEVKNIVICTAPSPMVQAGGGLAPFWNATATPCTLSRSR